jgi:hypothetical protein
MYFAAERLSYFAIASQQELWHDQTEIKPSQDGEEQFFEN